MGAYILAVGLRLFPIPSGPSNLHGPLWLLACAGLAFCVAIAFQTRGQANAAGDLVVEAPRWMHVDVKLVKKTRLLSLREMRERAELANMIVLRPGNRLSITPVQPEEWRSVLALLQA